MEIIKIKESILGNIDELFIEYQNYGTVCNEKIKNIQNENNNLHELNQKLMEELKEKDKLLIVNDKKNLDYEIMINQIQEQATKELTEKQRFDMLKKQDLEINERDIEIKRLNKKIESLMDTLQEEKKKTKLKEGDVVERLPPERVEVDPELWKTRQENSYWNDGEKVKVAIEAYSKHIGKEETDITIQEIASTSAGINIWYQQGIGPRRLKKNIINKDKDKDKDKDKLNIDDELEVETIVIDIHQEENIDDLDKWMNNHLIECSDLTDFNELYDGWISYCDKVDITQQGFGKKEIKEALLKLQEKTNYGLIIGKRKADKAPNGTKRDPKFNFKIKEYQLNNKEDINDNKEDINDNKEDINDNKEDINDNKEDIVDNKEDIVDNKEDIVDNKEEPLSDDEDYDEVEILEHNGKDYYIIVGKIPKYIYAIQDGELGDKVGIIDNNDKIFYNPSKK